MGFPVEWHRRGQRHGTPPPNRETKNPGKAAVLAAFPGYRGQRQKVEARGIEPCASTPETVGQQPLAETMSLPLAHSLARETEIDPDLARLIDAWPTLAANVKRMI